MTWGCVWLLIGIVMLLDRGGLGKDEEKQRKRKLQEIRIQESAKRRQLVEKEQTQNFRELVRSKRMQQRATHDLRKARLACQRLDESHNLSCIKSWYWPTEDDETELEDDASGENDSEEIMTVLLYQN